MTNPLVGHVLGSHSHMLLSHMIAQGLVSHMISHVLGHMVGHMVGHVVDHMAGLSQGHVLEDSL